MTRFYCVTPLLTRVRTRNYLHPILLVVALLALTLASSASANDQAIFPGIKGEAVAFDLEIADTQAKRKKGLMYRTELAENAGMLFVYSHPQVITMWMENTYIALDMLFLDRLGQIVSISENARPLSRKVISSQEPAKYVLEVRAGTARRLGLKAGDPVLLPPPYGK